MEQASSQQHSGVEPEEALPQNTAQRLSPADQARVNEVLQRGVNSVQRKPFRPLLLLLIIVLVLTGLSGFSYWLAWQHGVV